MNYTDPGVVVEAHRVNEYLAGLTNSMAVIKKRGFQNCKVPTKELWYTDAKKGGNVYFNKNFVTDKAFDQFLKSHCKFSMY